MIRYFAGLPLHKTLIMGIVNVTPDSFSDGGETFDHCRAIKRGLRQIAEGADIIDVGGESTRPGAVSVSPEEEIRRILPVVSGLAGQGAIVSIDTRHADVMEAALNRGAKIINDISALSGDARSLKVAAASKASIILMHMKGDPVSMTETADYTDVVVEVKNYLGFRIAACLEAGLDKDQLCIDPGIGFGKTTEHNFQLIDNLDVLSYHACPIMVGVSRKFGRYKLPDQRLEESLSLALKAVDRGTNILRVHDVAATRQAVDNWVLDRNELK